MDIIEKAKICQSLLKFIVFVGLGVICYFYLIEDAIKKSEKRATTITSRHEDSGFEYPAIIICPYPGFKPSLSQKLKYAAKDLFRHKTSDKHLFVNKTVSKVFEECTYGDSINISWGGELTPLKEGENRFNFGNDTEIITLKKVPTEKIGMCHVINLKVVTGKIRSIIVEYKDPINSYDVPKGFRVYLLPKNEWQGIVTRNWIGHRPFKIDTTSYSFPSTIFIQLTMNKFYPLDTLSEGSPVSTQWCIDTNGIKEKLKAKNCKELCIPIQYSSLVDSSEINICSDYDNHTCAQRNIQGYIRRLSKKIWCTKENVEKSYKGQVDFEDGLPYWITQEVREERRNNILFNMILDFDSDHVTVQEEELIYGPKDLLSWIGGALGIFVGYSIFDLTSVLLDWVFQFVFQVI